LRFPEVCEIDDDTDDGDDRSASDAQQGITGLNCAGFGSAMVVTATFGLVAAAQVLNKLAASVAPDSAA
jgi:tRNA A37 threonylcarbamoyladenosine dehydratase